MKLNFARIAQLPTPLRIGIFVLTLLVIWVPIALPIRSIVQDPNLTTIITMPLLYTAFLVLVRLWGRLVYREPNLFKVYGFRQPKQFSRELVKGLGIGLISLLTMFVLQGVLGWVQWQPLQSTFPRIVLEGGIVAIAYGFAEELLFRGWLVNELDRGYSPSTSLWASSLIFALLHGIRPQLPALVILGLTLVWAKRACRGRLGLSIGLHAGLIWGYYLVNVGQLFKFTNVVPVWVTGIDKNPLAGMMGILALSAIALSMRFLALRSNSRSI